LGSSNLHALKQAWSRVARWYIFKPKIPTWVILEGLEIEKVGVLLAI
jgi:hypothetical protein